jgi:hypothetical protein
MKRIDARAVCCRAGILQPRDLRVVDESFALSNQPAFLIRQYCMVLNLKPVRAIILPGKVLLFPRLGADGELLVRRPHGLTRCVCR